MADVLGFGERDEFLVGLSIVADTFFWDNARIYRVHDSADRFQEDRESTKLVYMDCRCMFESMHENDDEVKKSTSGSWAYSRCKLTFLVQDLVALGVGFAGLNPDGPIDQNGMYAISPEKDFVNVKATFYKIKKIYLDGPIHLFQALLIMECELVPLPNYNWHAAIKYEPV